MSRIETCPKLGKQTFNTFEDAQAYIRNTPENRNWNLIVAPRCFWCKGFHIQPVKTNKK